MPKSASASLDCPRGGAPPQLRQVAVDVLSAFPAQVLAFNAAAAALYGDIAAARERAGHPVDALDAQIAAICRSCAATLATRNTKNFVDTGVDLLNPWQA